jgi:hypothetical protein
MFSRINNLPHYEEITVCKRWSGFKGYENFKLDMGECPEGLSLERTDNLEGYSKRNCVWASTFQQSRNKRNNVWITVGSRTMILNDWAEYMGIDRGTIWARLKYGWSPEEAVLTPVGEKR